MVVRACYIVSRIAKRAAAEKGLEVLEFGVFHHTRNALEASLPHAVHHRVLELQAVAGEDRVEGRHRNFRIRVRTVDGYASQIEDVEQVVAHALVGDHGLDLARTRARYSFARANCRRG